MKKWFYTLASLLFVIVEGDLYGSVQYVATVIGEATGGDNFDGYSISRNNTATSRMCKVKM